MNLKFIFKEAGAGLSRNLTMTVAMIITTAISLALLATGVLLSGMTERTKDIYIGRVEVMVQLNDGISALDDACSSTECAELKSILENDDKVEKVTFRSKAQSFERFTELFSQSDPQLVEQTSPDAFPAALHVKLTDPTDTTPIEAIADNPAVLNVIDQGEEVQKATKNLDSIRNAAFLLSAVQAVAAVFLIANMVQIAAFSRRNEISIMRMVGATRWYTQTPFIVEAILAGLIGSVLAMGGLFLANTLVVEQAMASLYNANLIARVGSADIWKVAPYLFAVGILVSALTAQATLRWYVKK